MRAVRASIRARVLALVLGAGGLLWAGIATLTWIEARHELGERQ